MTGVRMVFVELSCQTENCILYHDIKFYKSFSHQIFLHSSGKEICLSLQISDNSGLYLNLLRGNSTAVVGMGSCQVVKHLKLMIGLKQVCCTIIHKKVMLINVA
jgi:hypothetical protein